MVHTVLFLAKIILSRRGWQHLRYREFHEKNTFDLVFCMIQMDNLLSQHQLDALIPFSHFKHIFLDSMHSKCMCNCKCHLSLALLYVYTLYIHSMLR